MLWLKEGRESKCQFDFRPSKVRNHLKIHVFRWHATYSWKYLNEGYNFAWNLTSIGDLHKKLWLSKVQEYQISEFRNSQLGSLGTKWHLDVNPMVNHREYYKGEGGGFPQVRAMVNIVSPCMPVVHLCTKNAPTMH
jgi:hypothetical protein